MNIEKVTSIAVDLFELLCQGAIAGLVVLYFTLKYQKKKEEHAVMNYAVMLELEIESHVQALKRWDTQTTNLQPEDLYQIVGISAWDSAQSTMVNIKPKHFHILSTYYHNAMIILQTCNSDKANLVDNRTVKNQYLMAVAMRYLMRAYTFKYDSKEFKTAIFEYEKKQIEVSSEWYRPNPS